MTIWTPDTSGLIRDDLKNIIHFASAFVEVEVHTPGTRL